MASPGPIIIVIIIIIIIITITTIIVVVVIVAGLMPVSIFIVYEVKRCERTSHYMADIPISMDLLASVLSRNSYFTMMRFMVFGEFLIRGILFVLSVRSCVVKS